MIQILLCGCGGRMGRAVTEAAAESCGRFGVIAGIDVSAPCAASEFPVYAAPAEFPGKADVIVDFSHHSALAGLLAYAVRSGTPAIIATTGQTDEETALLRDAAKHIPVFFSRNMSLGVNLLIELCKKAELALGEGFDVEIIEKHHKHKLDAPSGTALMIADAVSAVSESGTREYVYDRHTERKERDPGEIGIHSVRGGNIVGEHEVIFAGKDEIITLSHSATSREVFATGALRAAEFLVGKPAGLYSMSDIVGGL